MFLSSSMLGCSYSNQIFAYFSSFLEVRRKWLHLSPGCVWDMIEVSRLNKDWSHENQLHYYSTISLGFWFIFDAWCYKCFRLLLAVLMALFLPYNEGWQLADCRHPYMVPGIKLKSAVCNANNLHNILLFYTHGVTIHFVSHFINKLKEPLGF